MVVTPNIERNTIQKAIFFNFYRVSISPDIEGYRYEDRIFIANPVSSAANLFPDFVKRVSEIQPMNK